MKFYSAYCELPAMKPVECGSPFREKFGLVNDERGVKVPVLVEKINQQEYIDSFESDCSLKALIYKAGIEDDADFFTQRLDGLFLDTTQLPDNIFQLDDYLNNLESNYEKLSPEFKKHFSGFGDFKKVVSDDNFIYLLNERFKEEEKIND